MTNINIGNKIRELRKKKGITQEGLAFRLSGRDKLNGATMSRCHHLQSLYQACMKEGNVWFFMNQHSEVKFRDYTPDDYIPEALKCYHKGLRVLTTFLLTDYYDDPAEQYLWEGMQTFHWSFLRCIAACYKKLGNIEECEKYIAEAYNLISVVWKDFEENKKSYMEPFYKYLNNYDLSEYIKLSSFSAYQKFCFGHPIVRFTN